jgi:hypothetical protein
MLHRLDKQKGGHKSVGISGNTKAFSTGAGQLILSRVLRSPKNAGADYSIQ